MKWFKHMTIARTDPKLCAFQDREGSLEAYGFYFKIVEIVGAEVDDSGRCSACYSAKNWAKLTCVSATRWLRLSQVAAELQLWSCKNIGETWEICIPNILKHRDNYTKDLQATCKKASVNLPLIRLDTEQTRPEDITPQPPKGGEPRKARSRKSYDVEFEQFWATTRFPKKEQDDKGGMFKKYSAAIKAGITAAEIATAADAFADGNADNQFPIGMRRFLDPMTIREWLGKTATAEPSGPSKEDLQALADRMAAGGVV
jgi:hypothetical protein